MNKKRSQSSFEFLMVFGIGLLLIMIMGGVFLTFSNESKNDLDQKQLDKIAEEILRNVEKVYFWGDGNMLTMKASFPDQIENITIHHIVSPNGIRLDLLNISFIQENDITYGIYETQETYIYFNCTYSCENSVSISPDHNISYYGLSDISSGSKQLRIRSMGDWVAIDFYKE